MPRAFRSWSGRLTALAPSLIVLEVTGGYEMAVTAALASVGLPIIVVNPRHVRHFAKALGQLAKTDAINARTMACFAERVRPGPQRLRAAGKPAKVAFTACMGSCSRSSTRWSATTGTGGWQPPDMRHSC